MTSYVDIKYSFPYMYLCFLIMDLTKDLSHKERSKVIPFMEKHLEGVNEDFLDLNVDQKEKILKISLESWLEVNRDFSKYLEKYRN